MITQGFILIDEDGVALNNSGTVSVAGTENRVATKKITKNGQQYVYVSGQAWRYWWRETLQKHFNWKMSPLIKVEKQNVIYTEANPLDFDDDDVFGYMRANKEPVLNADGTEKKKKNGEVETKDATVTRISPLKNSVLISVGSVNVAKNFASASRQNDVPVLYGKEEYSAIMKGMFSLNLEQVGTFSNYNKTGFKNITKQVAELLSKVEGLTTLEDKFVRNKDGFEKLIRLPKPIRETRICTAIQALKFISGGAMQTSNMGDVTPKFIVLATATTGNHPFSHIVKSDPFNHEQVILNIDGLREVLNDYADQFKGTIFIGKRSGFMDEYNEELKAFETEFDGSKYKDEKGNEINKSKPIIKFVTVNQAIDQYCEQVKTQIP